MLSRPGTSNPKWGEMRQEDERTRFGARWRAARPGCGCGRDCCAGCALTPRTVFVLQAELAWLVDLAGEDIPAVESGARSISQTVFASLPVAAYEWAASMPVWLERFRRSARAYVSRLDKPGPMDPRTLAEEVALRMAFTAAHGQADPDGLLPPDVADALPALPGDYAWSRAEEAIGLSEQLQEMYSAAARLASRGDPLHPECWFELSRVRTPGD